MPRLLQYCGSQFPAFIEAISGLVPENLYLSIILQYVYGTRKVSAHMTVLCLCMLLRNMAEDTSKHSRQVFSVRIDHHCDIQNLRLNNLMRVHSVAPNNHQDINLKLNKPPLKSFNLQAL